MLADLADAENESAHVSVHVGAATQQRSASALWSTGIVYPDCAALRTMFGVRPPSISEDAAEDIGDDPQTGGKEEKRFQA